MILFQFTNLVLSSFHLGTPLFNSVFTTLTKPSCFDDTFVWNSDKSTNFDQTDFTVECEELPGQQYHLSRNHQLQGQLTTVRGGSEVSGEPEQDFIS